LLEVGDFKGFAETLLLLVVGEVAIEFQWIDIYPSTRNGETEEMRPSHHAYLPLIQRRYLLMKS
jgi:hypothetical protein